MKWEPAIRKAIRESEFFLALLSEKSNSKRGYVQKERKNALDVLEEFPEDQVYFSCNQKRFSRILRSSPFG
jgi:hypothetical protein